MASSSVPTTFGFDVESHGVPPLSSASLNSTMASLSAPTMFGFDADFYRAPPTPRLSCVPLPQASHVGTPTLGSFMERQSAAHPYSSAVALLHPNIVTMTIDITHEMPPPSFELCHEAATSPSVESITIRSSLPWEISVHASSLPYVTPWDILRALHEAVRCQMTGAENNFDTMDMNYGLRVDRRLYLWRESTGHAMMHASCPRMFTYFTGPLIWDSKSWVLFMQFGA